VAKRKLVGLLLRVIVLGVLAGTGYWLLRRTESNTCRICQRPIHAEVQAVIKVDGKREPVCCARRAITFSQQRNRPICLVEVTDYVSRTPRAPQVAYFVQDSRIIVYEKHEPLVDQSKHPYPRVFDRCVPSLSAFARREDAEAFVKQNGRLVLRLSQLIKEVKSAP